MSVKPFKYVIGEKNEKLDRCLDYLKGKGFSIRWDHIKKVHNARRRISDKNQIHIIIKKPGKKWLAYLHVDEVIEDFPHLIHRAVRNKDEIEKWGVRIFGNA